MRTSPEALNIAREKAKELLKELTLEEKIGQLSQFGTSIYTDRVDYHEEHYQTGKIGAYLTVNGAKLTNEIQKKVLSKIPHKIPVLFGEDVIHGYKTTFPIPLAQSCSFNPELTKISSKVAAKEAYCAGVKWVFSPMVDIARDPRWGRICEGYGEDPLLCSRFAAAAVDGYEGKGIGEKYSVISCLKHFAAYGACIGGRDYNAVDISLQTLYDVYLPSFKAGVKAGCASIMTAFVSLNGVPCTANQMLLKNILREKWGFDGFVVSDSDSVYSLTLHGFAKDLSDAAKNALNAGVDMNMQGENYNSTLPKLVEEGKVSQEVLDESVLRILTIKYLLGLFDTPFVDETEERCFFCDEHLEKATHVAEESIVLLKNDNDTLPIVEKGKNIAIVGPLADDNRNVLGNWACRAEPDKTITILDGIKNLAENQSNISYAKGCDIDDLENDELLHDAIKVMQNSDVIILALGERFDESAEAKCTTTLRLHSNQEKLWKCALEIGKPVVVMISAGRPLAFGDLAEKTNSILYLWQLGTCTGTAVARTVFGLNNPSGHLTTSFPHNVGQIPIFYNHTNTDHPPLDKVWYESKYIDCPIKPDYCFGYGLSYTKFELSNLELSNNEMKSDGYIDISFTVKNKGLYDGKAVVQLYVQDIIGSCVRPIKELKDFAKIMLKSGEEKYVSFRLKAADLGFHNQELAYIVESGEFNLWVAQNCDDDNALYTQFSIID